MYVIKVYNKVTQPRQLMFEERFEKYSDAIHLAATWAPKGFTYEIMLEKGD